MLTTIGVHFRNNHPCEILSFSIFVAQNIRNMIRIYPSGLQDEKQRVATQMV
jgi:hypothetical protein